MKKQYMVRLSEEARHNCLEVVKKLKGSSQKVKRTQRLLKTDVNGSAWTDAKIAAAFHCRVHAIEHLRKRVVTEGFASGLAGKKRAEPPTLAGQGQATRSAMRLGRAPAGYGRGTLRVLANALVPLEVVAAICPETGRHTRNKTA